MVNAINIPPQAIDIEKAVLGILMLERESYSKISSFLNVKTFYLEAHREIYGIIQKIYESSRFPDMITVSNELRDSGKLDFIGGAHYLTELTDNVVSSVTIEQYSLVLSQKFLQREMISICQTYAKSAFDSSVDIFELYDNLSSELFKKVSVNAGSQASEFIDIYKERLKHYEVQSPSGLTGIPSGFKSVDNITSGWQGSDLIILAARPGMGKTAFVLNLARNASVEGERPGVIFSLEMSKEQLADRLISAETGVDFGKIKNRNLNEFDWNLINGNKMNNLINSKIFIDDTPSIPIQVLRSKVIRLKKKHNIGWIVVDYLQLMRGERDGKGGNREQEISSISRGLKGIAKELNVPVIALSQLSRAVESRPGAMKRPMLSDLRESGSIEQDADQVVFLFRPEYYGMVEDAEGNSTVGQCEVIFAKNRHGVLDTAVVEFNGSIMKFVDLETDFPPLPTNLNDYANHNFGKDDMPDDNTF